MIDLYGCGSPNVLKILYMLSETGLPWQLHHVVVSHGEQFKPEFLALNPNAKVPVIVDSDGPLGQPHTVFESGAILLYLAGKTGFGLPADPAARSRAIQWLMWQMASVGPQFGQAAHFTYIAPAGNDYGRARFMTEVNRLYDVADAHLGGHAWFAGNEFSIADIACYPWLGKYAKTLGIDIQTRPHVARWTKDFEARAAYLAINDYAKALYKAERAAQDRASPDDLDRFFGRGRHAVT